jgi:glycosyltransferase involved in cell wall biosynthesis
VGTDRRPVVWFEVEDLLRYFDHFRTPTGSQRVPFEIFVEAQRLYARQGRVRFCRLSVYTKRLMPVEFDAIISAYVNPPGANAPWKTVWAPARLLNEFSKMAPVIIRNPRFFLRLSKTAVRDFIDRTAWPLRFEQLAQPGDIVISLGASWGLPDYAKHIAAAKARYGIRFAFLIYDMIPIENASLVERRHTLQFRKWLQETASNADMILTISQYSRRVLLDFAAAAGWTVPRIEVVRLGGGFSPRPMVGGRSKIRLPRPYVLFVSTIEIRKNHGLLVRLWRLLIARHGVDAVPILIFAGQIGWMVDDLLADLAASGYLGGKIEHRPGLSDEDLAEAYRGCLFTIFPSLCEGWGLPIAESLAHGKFCVASNRTSIPEVGGDLIDYFDPSDDDDALAKIERLLFEPGYLTAREARLRAEYRPRSSIEQSLRSAVPGNDPAELRDAAIAAMRAAVTGDQQQTSEARDRAAEVISRAQNMSIEDARKKVQQYEQQYRQAVDQAKQQATQAADTAAKAVSGAALLGFITLLLGAIAGWFGGRFGAVEATLPARRTTAR